MDKEIKKIQTAQILADAMIKEIKEKNLLKDVIEHGDDVDGLFKTIMSLFSYKLAPLMMKYVTTDEEVQKEMDDETKAELDVFKSLFGGEFGGDNE